MASSQPLCGPSRGRVRRFCLQAVGELSGAGARALGPMMEPVTRAGHTGPLTGPPPPLGVPFPFPMLGNVE